MVYAWGVGIDLQKNIEGIPPLLLSPPSEIGPLNPAIGFGGSL